MDFHRKAYRARKSQHNEPVTAQPPATSTSIRNSSMPIISFIMTHLRSISHLDLRHSQNIREDSDLRPCQQCYLGDDKPRRWFPRSILGKKPPHNEAIFATHEANPKKREKWTYTHSPTTTRGSSYSAVCVGGVDEKKRVQDLQKDRQVLLRSLNSARRLEKVMLLESTPQLSDEIQRYADTIDPFQQAPANRKDVQHLQLTSITLVADGVRLISPLGLGALACGELWCGGKYRVHAFEWEKDREHVE